MVLPDMFSRRKRQASGRIDPLIYDEMPQKVRRQVIHIFDEILGMSYRDTTHSRAYEKLVEVFRKEQGVARLIPYNRAAHVEFDEWFMTHEIVDEVIDAIEAIFRIADRVVRQTVSDQDRIDGAISEINARLFEASIGYQYEGGQVIQADSRVLHVEVVVPTLALLQDPKFEAANSEFLRAFDAMRREDYETALTECAKAFESVLKVMAVEKNWAVPKDPTAKRLLDAAFDAGLIPAFLQNEFSGLRAILEGGVPTLRNKTSAHGAGEKPRQVPKHLAWFQLHQTAAAIMFLAEAHRA